MSPPRALGPRFSTVFAVLGAGLGLASCSATSSSQAIVDDDAAVSAGGTGGSTTNGGSSGGGTTAADSDGAAGTAGGTPGTGGSAGAGSEAGASSDARADAPPAKPFCNGRTGDLSTDSHNCGACGNICQPQGIAYGLNEPSSLVADSKYVYWAERAASGRIFQVQLGRPNTANPPVIATNQKNPRSLVVDSTNVYWIAADGVYRHPVAGGSAVSIATEPTNRSPGGIALDGTSIYWTTHRDTAPNRAVVKKMPLGGGTAVELSTLDVVDFEAIAVDATNVYWVYTDYLAVLSARHDEIVFKAPVGGGTPVEFYRFSEYTYSSIRDMVVRDGYLYLGIQYSGPAIPPSTNRAARVLRLPLAGGEPETVVVILNEVYVGFGINTQGAFVAGNNANVVGGSIHSKPNGPVTAFALGWPQQPTGFTGTETHLYIGAWEQRSPNGGTVDRIGLCVNSVCQ